MTWYDHETESIWTQPWGRALQGSLRGTQLQLIPFSLAPWATWLKEHPDTLALHTEGHYSRLTESDNFVAGVAIGDFVRAYPYLVISQLIVINDTLGDIPLLVYTNPETRSIHIFVRQLSDGTHLTFEAGDTLNMVTDTLTGSAWDMTSGRAIEGELRREALREIPYISSFDWAWIDFYPNTDFYGL